MADLQGRPTEDHSAQFGLAANAPRDGDQTAQAVPQYEQGLARRLAHGADELHVEVVDIFLEAADHAARAVGLAVTAKVGRRDGVAAAAQGFGRRRIATAVLDKAVDQQHFGPRLAGRLPAPLQEPQTVGGQEDVFVHITAV